MTFDIGGVEYNTKEMRTILHGIIRVPNRTLFSPMVSETVFGANDGKYFLVISYNNKNDLFEITREHAILKCRQHGYKLRQLQQLFPEVNRQRNYTYQ